VVLNATNVRVRDGQVANRPGLRRDRDRFGRPLGHRGHVGNGGGKSAKFSMVVLTELRNRGVVNVF
jgi:hypothetical protein